MIVHFKCKEEKLLITLDTDTKPSIGETVRCFNKDYEIKEIIWCLEKPPIQSGIVIKISPKAITF